MEIKDFLKEKAPLILLVWFGLATVELFLLAYPVGTFLMIYIPAVVTGMLFLGLLVEFWVKRNFYARLRRMLAELEEKYLIAELIGEPEFAEGKLLTETLRQADKSMTEQVNRYKYAQQDYKEYIELWIHEIKQPIAASRLMIENNKNPVTKSLGEELDKVENFVEQALFYARSSAVEKDYYIRRVRLEEPVSESVRKNKHILIPAKAAIRLRGLETEVFTDGKWVVFLLNQLIQNSVKYRRQDIPLEIEFRAVKGREQVVLSVTDNGLGIPQADVGRVFEKGFTGSNGRASNKKSTGIGLYLCKKLCDRLGIGIGLDSAPGEGTQVRLIFPQGSHTDMG